MDCGKTAVATSRPMNEQPGRQLIVALPPESIPPLTMTSLRGIESAPKPFVFKLDRIQIADRDLCIRARHIN